MYEAYIVAYLHEKKSQVIFQEIAHLFNDREYPRLAIVVTVGSDAEIDLLREGVGLVCRGELENAVAMREAVSSGVV